LVTGARAALAPGRVSRATRLRPRHPTRFTMAQEVVEQAETGGTNRAMAQQKET
jgi:hypothetical protein